ncbi:Zinc finger A20 and AN1 domain-containing stress-associated protein 1 [Cardamine amara subsp. amara]|uniref:Zinc finger A20 and AN1 domain-containing stress-associated protein 1 n=1 Tax=Cardamine amara subsp. amara TaxID=228776 RepID=A0ABD1B872_CARAN
MGSEQNDSFSPSEPKLCVKGCGFFGSPSNMNLCSKCYRDIRAKEEQAASAKAAMEKSLNPNKPKIQPQQSHEITPGVESGSSSSTNGGDSAAAPLDPPKSTTRCLSCNKKVGVTGFKCKCGSTFCGAHRYPESHQCEFDFKGAAREAIAKANPVVKADKVEKI